MNTRWPPTFFGLAHEKEEGVFDFETGLLATAEFLRMAQQEGLFVILRPGPYCCGEWDLGGIPPYLLENPDANLRKFAQRKATAPPWNATSRSPRRSSCPRW